MTALPPPPLIARLTRPLGLLVSWQVPLAILLVLMLAAAFAPWIVPHDPYVLDPAQRLQPPDGTFWLGTDAFGRDVLSRAITGGRVSLGIGLAVALLSTAIGLVLGMIAVQNRVLEALVMRTMDGLMAIPGILLAIALLAILGGSVLTVIVAITIVEVPRVTRLVQSLVLSMLSLHYVEAARLAGARLPMLMLRHILPNIAAPIIVQATFIGAAAILVEAYLSFLGVGTPAEVPSWGNMIADGRRFVLVTFRIVLYPSIFLAVTVLCINLLGDRLRDRLDPRLARRL